MLHFPCVSRQSTAHISFTASMVSSASLLSMFARKCGRANRRNQSITVPFNGVIRGWREMVCTSKPADSSSCEMVGQYVTMDSLHAVTGTSMTYYVVVGYGWEVPRVEILWLIPPTPEDVV